MKGKAYANKKKKYLRPEGDFYETPRSLFWELSKKEKFNDCILEPSCGNMSLVKAMQDCGYSPEYTDLDLGDDFLERDLLFNGDIIFNPPFSLWDNFVFKAKELSMGRVVSLGKLDYFACYGRSQSGIWNGLHKVYIFNRKVDYRTEHRDDGLFHVGALNTGWFIWDKAYTGKPEIEIIDVQPYAKLGAYKKD